MARMLHAMLTRVEDVDFRSFVLVGTGCPGFQASRKIFGSDLRRWLHVRSTAGPGAVGHSVHPRGGRA